MAAKGSKTGASPNGHGRELVPEELRLRACAFVVAVGNYEKAGARLKVAKTSIEAACDRGHLKVATIERIREALDREAPRLEAKAS